MCKWFKFAFDFSDHVHVSVWLHFYFPLSGTHVILKLLLTNRIMFHKLQLGFKSVSCHHVVIPCPSHANKAYNYTSKEKYQSQDWKTFRGEHKIYRYAKICATCVNRGLWMLMFCVMRDFPQYWKSMTCMKLFRHWVAKRCEAVSGSFVVCPKLPCIRVELNKTN